MLYFITRGQAQVPSAVKEREAIQGHDSLGVTLAFACHSHPRKARKHHYSGTFESSMIDILHRISALTSFMTSMGRKLI